MNYEDDVIKFLAQKEGIPESRMADLFRDQKAKLVAKKKRAYEYLKRRHPELTKLEGERLEKIRATAAQMGISESAATAVVVLGDIEMERGMRRLEKRKLTEKDLQDMIGVSDPLPQDILDMLDNEKP